MGWRQKEPLPGPRLKQGLRVGGFSKQDCTYRANTLTRDIGAVTARQSCVDSRERNLNDDARPPGDYRPALAQDPS